MVFVSLNRLNSGKTGKRRGVGAEGRRDKRANLTNMLDVEAKWKPIEKQSL